MNKFFFLLAFLLSTNCFCQTSVSGGIYSNTTWSLANSPYTVTSQVTVFPGVILTIAPGVIVKFADSVKMEVRGNLVAIGSVNDSIEFRSSSSSPYAGIWPGIFINNVGGGLANIGYAIFRHADIAFDVSCYTVNAPINIAHSTFNENRVGVGGYSASKLPIDSCMFLNNKWGVAATNRIIHASGFLNNEYGLCWGKNIDVYDSWFCGNFVALYSEEGDLQNCIIMNNTIGVQPINGGFFNVNGNTIAENGVGIAIGAYNGAANPIGTNNKICNNINYDLINGTMYNVSIPNNCWCDTDSANISLKIYDGYDDISRGLVFFSPVIVCDSSILPAKPCNSVPVNTQIMKYSRPQMEVFPNPSSEKVTITFSEIFKEIKLIDLLGKEVRTIKLSARNNKEIIDVSDLENGIYFFTILSGKESATQKLVIQH